MLHEFFARTVARHFLKLSGKEVDDVDRFVHKPEERSRLLVEITLKSGQNLKSKDANGLSDPYVTFVSSEIEASEAVRSTTKFHTLNPDWNFEVIKVPIIDADNEVIEISVFDNDNDRPDSEDQASQGTLFSKFTEGQRRNEHFCFS